MRFEQAYYGATSNGHNLLACAPNLRPRFLALLDRTDRQGILPAGLNIESYVTALRSGSDFVIMRMSPDTSVARGGMVFSHVLLTPLEQIGNLPSLMGLTSILQVQRPSDLSTETLILDDRFFDQEPKALPTPPRQSCIALANALVAKRSSLVVWSGIDDFLPAIDSLWRTAWPELRRMLTFSVAFTPQDAHLSEYSVVYTPPSEINRWTGFQILNDRSNSDKASPSAVALVGGPGSESLRDVAQQIRWQFKRLADLEHIASLQQGLVEVELVPREEIRNMRLLCFLASDPSTAIYLKSTFLERACASISSADIVDLLACRNLTLDCFQEAARFWVALTDRISSLFKRDEARDLPAEFLMKVSKETGSPWKLAVTEGMRKGLHSFSPAQATAIWSWILRFPELSELLFSVLPSERGSESMLEGSFPKQGLEDSLSVILRAVGAREMLRLAAKLLHSYLRVDKAFDWQLSHAKNGSGLSELVQMYTPRTTVDQCVRTADARLVPFAKQAIVSDVDLLMDADLRSKGWRAILIALRGTGVKFRRGDKFHIVQQQMLDLITSTPQAEELWNSLEALGLFDFSALADSAQLWKKLPKTLLSRMVAATADATVTRVSTGELRLDQVADELRGNVQDRPRILRVLRDLGVTKIAQQLRLFNIFPQLTEQDFLSWYSPLLTNVKPLEAGAVVGIGSLIADRKWKTAAENTVRDIIDYRRSDLTPLLPEVKPLLSIKQRFKLIMVGVSSSTPRDLSPGDFWSQLEDELAERFPGGPRDQALWSRSKGADADLLVGGSGREQWRHALQLVRENTHGSATLENLLNEAVKSFPYDRSLAWLQNHWWQVAPEVRGR